MRAAAQAAIDVIKTGSHATSDVLDLAIHSIFFRNSTTSGGGSTSNALGVIWLNNRSNWSTNDLAELLIHELTHNLVFLDEIRHLHIIDYKLLPKPENYAVSAILKTSRPLDKVFHSIVVSAEVLAARDAFLGHPCEPKVHPPSEQLREDSIRAWDSLHALRNIDSLLTERGFEIMARARELLT